MILRKFIFTSLLFVGILFSLPSFAMTIVVDPGHGGDEDGAIAQTVGENPPRVIKEKDLTLSIAKKIHDLLKKKGYRVFLTRSVDRTVTLAERAAIAEKTKADLFISVHINSSTEHNATGFETYYLDNHQDAAIKKVESVENVQRGNQDTIVEQILVDLVVEQTVKTSRPLAQAINQSLKLGLGKKYRIPSRGAKPGLFYVLALSKRPGVLLEAGFLSTLKDRQKIMDEKYQMDYAHSVVEGINEYLKKK